MKINSVLIYCSLVLVIRIQPTWAGSDVGSCKEFYKPLGIWKTIAKNSGQYFREIKQSKGRSLVLVPPSGEVIDSKLKGVLTASVPAGIVGSVVQYPFRHVTKMVYGSSYDFRPMRSLDYFVIQPSVRYASEKVLKKTYELSKTFIFSTVILTSIVTNHYFDVYANQKTGEKFVEVALTKHKQYYEDLLNGDYRFQSLAKGKNSGALSADQSLVYSAKLRFALNEHLKKTTASLTNNSQSLKDSEIDSWLTDPGFGKLVYGDILEMLTKGVNFDSKLFKPDSDYTSKLSAEKLADLVLIRNQTFADLEMIDQKFRSPSTYKQWLEVKKDRHGTAVNQKLGDKDDEPYYNRLKTALDLKQITMDQFIFLVQENIFWNGKFKIWKALGLVPLKTNQIDLLTIQDIQAETLEGLKLN